MKIMKLVAFILLGLTLSSCSAKNPISMQDKKAAELGTALRATMLDAKWEVKKAKAVVKENKAKAEAWMAAEEAVEAAGEVERKMAITIMEADKTAGEAEEMKKMEEVVEAIYMTIDMWDKAEKLAEKAAGSLRKAEETKAVGAVREAKKAVEAFEVWMKNMMTDGIEE